MEFEVSLGDGNDHFFAGISNDIESSSRLGIKVNGESGSDWIIVEPKAGIHSGAALSLDLDGGDDDDHIIVEYEGRIDGDLQLRAAGGSGSDNIRVVIEVSPESSGRLFGLEEDSPARVEGNGGDDKLTFRVHAEDSDQFVVDAILDGGDNSPFDGGNDWGLPTSNVHSSGVEIDWIRVSDDQWVKEVE